jgi:hypothetical protein
MKKIRYAFREASWEMLGVAGCLGAAALNAKAMGLMAGDWRFFMAGLSGGAAVANLYMAKCFGSMAKATCEDRTLLEKIPFLATLKDEIQYGDNLEREGAVAAATFSTFAFLSAVSGNQPMAIYNLGLALTTATIPYESAVRRVRWLNKYASLPFPNI